MPLWRTASCTSSVMSVTVSPPAVWSWCSTWNVFTRPTFCQPRTVSTGRNRHVDGGACAGASPQTTARLALGLCEVICPSCGQENPAGFRLCGMCGTPLEAAAPARQERKVLTVLFADLVGFTSRAEEMDPEDVRALLGPYWERLRDELEHFGGTVEKFIGDAVVALFGAPTAHEDDPERPSWRGSRRPGRRGGRSTPASTSRCRRRGRRARSRSGRRYRPAPASAS